MLFHFYISFIGWHVIDLVCSLLTASFLIFDLLLLHYPTNQGDLICFQRTGVEAIPGCPGAGINGRDYCYDPGTCIPAPRTCGCADASPHRQSDYTGTTATTVSGYTCQAWASQSPHTHTRTPENYPDSGLDANYCLNPDGEDAAWCYTTDSDERWELCDVPFCATTTTATTTTDSPTKSPTPVVPTISPTDVPTKDPSSSNSPSKSPTSNPTKVSCSLLRICNMFFFMYAK